MPPAATATVTAAIISRGDQGQPEPLDRLGSALSWARGAALSHPEVGVLSRLDGRSPDRSPGPARSSGNRCPQPVQNWVPSFRNRLQLLQTSMAFHP